MFSVRQVYDAPEIEITKELIRGALKRYWTVSVFAGDKWTIEKSRSSRDIFKAMFLAETEKLRFRTMIGKFVGDIVLCYGDGEDVIFDWSNRYEIKELVASIRGVPLQ